MQYTREIFKKVKRITGATTLSTTAVSVAIKGECITVISLAGNVWINPLATAVADQTAIKITDTSKPLDLLVDGNLSLISDVAGATYQIIYWDI